MTDTDLEPDELGASKDDAHQVALELVKQLITLSSGLLALSATFIDKFRDPFNSTMFLLVGSWLALIVSVSCGIDTISVIVKSRLRPEMDWSEGRGKMSARLSRYGFVVGLALFAIFALTSYVGSHQAPCPPSATYITR
jgi:hypothetical protein